MKLAYIDLVKLFSLLDGYSCIFLYLSRNIFLLKSTIAVGLYIDAEAKWVWGVGEGFTATPAMTALRPLTQKTDLH